jgi:hypothetical protein
LSAKNRLSLFLARPLGGVELESFICLEEFCCGAVLLASASSAESTPALYKLIWYIPHYILAVPWLMSVALTVTGLALFERGDRRCAPLRFAAAILSAFIWSWMTIKTLSVAGLQFEVFLFAAPVLASIRIAAGAWQREWPSHGGE